MTADPFRVPATFWQRDDVGAAVDDRDIGGLFRLLRQYCGASQTRIGIAVGLAQGAISRIMNGSQLVTAITVLERIADGLQMPDDARMRLGLAPKEDPMRRRTALGLGLVAALSPTSITAVLRESAAEALEFTRERAVSAVGTGTLDHLDAVIAELDRAYNWQPAAKLFPIARAYRHEVARLINGQHTPARGPRALRPCRPAVLPALRPGPRPRFATDRRDLRHRQLPPRRTGRTRPPGRLGLHVSVRLGLCGGSSGSRDRGGRAGPPSRTNQKPDRGPAQREGRPGPRPSRRQSQEWRTTVRFTRHLRVAARPVTRPALD